MKPGLLDGWIDAFIASLSRMHLDHERADRAGFPLSSGRGEGVRGNFAPRFINSSLSLHWSKAAALMLSIAETHGQLRLALDSPIHQSIFPFSPVCTL